MLDECIIIDYDVNDRPLVDTLVKAGVSRQRIVLCYAGEPVPDAA